MHRQLLQLEGLAVFSLSLYFYWINDFSWLFFFLIILVPDLSAIGYLMNHKSGALLYNIFHTYLLSLLIIFLGGFLSIPTLLAIGIIWTAHIGIDRAFGFGLKYPTSFQENHLKQM